ncbi:MAG: hypothetical protein GEEBNDBF_01445 [bacterium]|nr:hypothetical protein [bacterium]
MVEASATAPGGEMPAPVAGDDQPGEGALEENDERGLPNFRRSKKEPRTFEEKLRAYKKQSQERLLDVKRSREAKLGGKKLRR